MSGAVHPSLHNFLRRSLTISNVLAIASIGDACLVKSSIAVTSVRSCVGERTFQFLGPDQSRIRRTVM